MMGVLVIMNMLMCVDMSMLYTGCKVLQNLLQKKTAQYKQPDQLYLTVATVQFRKYVYYGNTKKISPGKYKQ